MPRAEIETVVCPPFGGGHAVVTPPPQPEAGGPPGKARPVRAIGLREGDRVAAACAAEPDDQLLFASAGGTLLSHHCRSVPAQGRAAKGAALKRRGWAGSSDPIVGQAVPPLAPVSAPAGAPYPPAGLNGTPWGWGSTPPAPGFADSK